MFSHPQNHSRISQKEKNSTQWQLVVAVMENRYNVPNDGNVNTMFCFVLRRNINCSLARQKPHAASKSTSRLFAC